MKDRTYRYFHGQPLCPFGYGLSYSKFTYSKLRPVHSSVKAGDALDVDVDVTNAHGPDGDDVVELYVVPPQEPGNPIRALRAFKRVHVAKGKTEHVRLSLDPRALSFVDTAGDRWVAAGNYRLIVGHGSSGVSPNDLAAGFTITGRQMLPE